MRAVNHTQTQQSWCLVLQVENNSILVDSACDVHLTDRNLVEKSGQKTVPSSSLNIIAAGNHSLEHCAKTMLHFEGENGQSNEGSFDVSEISKTIMSVAQLVDKGYQVVILNRS